MSTYKHIFEAAQKGSVADVAFFIEKLGDDVTNVNLILAAAENEDIEVLMYLISKGADLNAKRDSGEEVWGGQTLLHSAARSNNNIAVLEYLISNGADINAKDDEGKTPLHYAAHNKISHVIRFLIRQGADINAKDKYGNTALDEAYTGEQRHTSQYGNLNPYSKALVQNINLLREAGGVCGKKGCLVFIAALGALLSSGICGLALFIATAWKF